MDVSDAKCIYVTIKGVGMSIWKLYNNVELVVVENVGVDPRQPLKGYSCASYKLSHCESQPVRNLGFGHEMKKPYVMDVYRLCLRS